MLSFGKGIVHPYYVSAIGPGAAAMVGGWSGGVRRARKATPAASRAGADRGGATVAAQLTLLGDEPHYMRWFFPVMIAGAAIGVVTLLLSAHLARPAMALTLCLLLIAPAAYAATTWEFAVRGHVPRRRAPRCRDRSARWASIHPALRVPGR